MSNRLFEDAAHAKLYATYRPTYPDEVFWLIKDFCTAPESSGCEVAVDVGCGSGQATFRLCDIFNTVIGVDISQSQINEAKRLQSHFGKYDSTKLDFRVGPAENLSFKADSSVDLVSVAAAIHWLDQEKFYTEVQRILKPGGALVVYTYTMPKPDKVEAIQIETQFFDEHLTKFGGLSTFPNLENYDVPYGDMVGIRIIPVYQAYNVEQYVGFIRTLSNSQKYIQHNTSSVIFDDLTKRLKRLYTDPVSSAEIPVNTSSSVSIKMGRKPRGVVDINLFNRCICSDDGNFSKSTLQTRLVIQNNVFFNIRERDKNKLVPLKLRMILKEQSCYLYE